MAIIARKPRAGKIEIDLSGPEGNAFVLLGRANDYGRQIGYSKKELDALRAEMTAGDYEHLLQVFDKHFGLIVDLIRD